MTQAPPEVGYTCWDGRSAADLAVCGTPSGRAGLLYAFPSLANALDSCELDSPRITHRPGTTSYRCVGPDGTVVLYRYWTAGSDGLAHLDETYADNPVRSDLILDGQVAGFLYSGRLTTGAYNATARLQNGHFTASAISVNSSEERDYGSATITFRSPADANGHPANAYPRVAIRD